MSETEHNSGRSTRKSLQRLRDLWRAADTDTKHDLALWFIGLALMALALVEQFGLTGALFCVGLVIWRAGCVGMESGK